MSWLLIAQQRRPQADPAPVAPLPSWTRVALAIQAAVMLMVGVPMLLIPQGTLGVWPWALTPLTCRAIGAWAIGIGTIAAHAAWENDLWRLRPMMLSYTLLGLLQLTSVLRYPGDLDWSRTAALIYVVFLGTVFLLGCYGSWKTFRLRLAVGG
jgi:hypothetical protein